MATPDFVLALRRKIGNDLLFLSGVTAVVLKDNDVLLVRGAESGAWTPVTGIIDPGEEPADAAVRETYEEAPFELSLRNSRWYRHLHHHSTTMGIKPSSWTSSSNCVGEQGLPTPLTGKTPTLGGFPSKISPTCRRTC
ncbi:hypothetical protein AHiyo1_44520 [Arthrobacter sp. Hiyo1]|nr:hypothetical protein AHiyo1_44520 [Arthrobacter sp. Hiyo1]